MFAYAVPADNGVTLRALYMPFVKDAVIADMHIFAVAMFALIIVGASNAVNLTDGLDGLATGCSLTTALAYAAFGYICGNARYSDYLGVAHQQPRQRAAHHRDGARGCLPRLPLVQCASGQDVHGRHRLARARRLHRRARHRLQTGDRARPRRRRVRHGGHERDHPGLSFKKRGKRVFRMAPIHHHFELGGWHENQVIVRFWVLSLLFAMLGLATLKLR
jgi:phospho-N-acetylmuramoyl-pentapeptide-transferase